MPPMNRMEPEDLILKAEGDRLRPSAMERPLVIRYYCGGSKNGQVAPFEVAARQVKKTFGHENIKFESLTLKEMREDEKYWTLEAFVDWLLGSHIHFLLCYVHQGLESFGWTVTDIMAELRRLQFHEGFPNGKQLSCPVFTQDKIKYLQLIPNFTLQSHAISLPKDIESFFDCNYEEEISRKDNNHESIEHEGCAWVIKAPFTSNSMYYLYRTVRDLDHAVQIVRNIVSDQHSSQPKCYKIPYVILQEKVDDDNEVKMVYLNGGFNHFVVDGKSRRIRQSLNGFTKSDLIGFGNLVMQNLAVNSNNSCIVEGIFRVDIFKGNDGQLVVNELETMDMAWYSSREEDAARVVLFLEQYWETKIYECINRLFK